MASTGTWMYVEGQGVIQISDRIPKIASRALVGGEYVFCERNGETLDFGTGPIRVNSESEKRRVLREHGVAPAPSGVTGIKQPKFDPSSMPSFAEHFRKEQGVSLEDATGLVHVKER